MCPPLLSTGNSAPVQELGDREMERIGAGDFDKAGEYARQAKQSTVRDAQEHGGQHTVSDDFPGPDSRILLWDAL